MLTVNNVSKLYRRGGREFAAVDGITFTVAKGGFTVISGHSGSGKSTLLNIIAGLLKPDNGTVTLDGADLTALGDRELSELRNQKIGYIPQGHSVLENLTVLENTALPFYLGKRPGGGEPYSAAKTLLTRMGIAELAGQYPAELSGGELRRASIARALINSPALLIADEPTSDLDLDNARTVMSLFADTANSGVAVIVVTHETQSLEGLTYSSIKLKSGKED
ncbi:MAG: ABC transporter ATP-binding protein [Oscillospiraceae bacterium]|jgi:putative ABC transport system ATP-binding protein|nr:ABC transporter ATP-binding protein [Oscillospiraceae bacterium]